MVHEKSLVWRKPEARARHDHDCANANRNPLDPLHHRDVSLRSLLRHRDTVVAASREVAIVAEREVGAIGIFLIGDVDDPRKYAPARIDLPRGAPVQQRVPVVIVEIAGVDVIPALVHDFDFAFDGRRWLIHPVRAAEPTRRRVDVVAVDDHLTAGNRAIECVFVAGVTAGHGKALRRNRRPAEVPLDAFRFQFAVADVEAVGVAENHVRAAFGIQRNRVVERLYRTARADFGRQHLFVVEISDGLPTLQTVEFCRLRRPKPAAHHTVDGLMVGHGVFESQPASEIREVIVAIRRARVQTAGRTRRRGHTRRAVVLRIAIQTMVLVVVPEPFDTQRLHQRQVVGERPADIFVTSGHQARDVVVVVQTNRPRRDYDRRTNRGTLLIFIQIAVGPLERAARAPVETPIRARQGELHAGALRAVFFDRFARKEVLQELHARVAVIRRYDERRSGIELATPIADQSHGPRVAV